MEIYQSFIYYRLNPLTQDKITVGIVITTKASPFTKEKNQSVLKISDKNIAIVESLKSENVFSLFKDFIRGLAEYQKISTLTYSIVDDLSIKQNGLIGITSPSRIAISQL